MKAKQNKKNSMLLIGILVVLFLMMTGCGAVSTKKNDSSEKTEKDTATEEADYHNLVYRNKNYTYNPQITTVLYAGVDSDGELTTSNRCSIAPRADSIELIVLDNYHKTMKVLAISRDTITAMERYTMNGNSRGKYDTQLGYAFSYGDGGKVSCLNLSEAVSELLGGVPVHEYVISNRASLVELNNMLGGITVKVPNDDLGKDYPELKKGGVVTLDDTNVEAFVRWRDVSVPFSNNGRMERQQAFGSVFLEKLKEEIAKDPDGVWKEIERMSPYLETSITRSQYLTLADLVNKLTFSTEDYSYIDGENVQGEQYDEVHLDQESLEKTIVDLFYIEDGEVEE